VSEYLYCTPDGTSVPPLTAEQMREVDRIAVQEFGLGILQMMENAGRTLALHVIDMLGQVDGAAPVRSSSRDRGSLSKASQAGAGGKALLVTVLAGSGGNGGGGLCCARHLHNRGFGVDIVLSKEPGELQGAAREQLDVLRAAGVQPLAASQARASIAGAQIVVDALIGYSLRGAPRGRTAELIEQCNARPVCGVLSLDVPSGLNATTGEAPGVVVRAARTLTLALPKTGLHDVPGDLYLADIGIPPEVYQRLGLSFEPPFRHRYWVPLTRLG
jgi:NAD(P)H-hydrate epimerase